MKVHYTDAERMFRELDLTGDGELTYQEFCQILGEGRDESPVQIPNVYQTNVDLDILERVTRMRALSTKKGVE
jgi:hypothetical protein